MKLSGLLVVLVPVLGLASAAPVGQIAAGDSTAVKRGWLGVYTDELTKPMLVALDLDHGVLVTDVAEGSPAEKAGVQVGDVIVSLDGRSTADGSALRWAVRDRPNQKVTVKVRRRGKDKNLDVTLGARDETAQSFNFEWPGIPAEAMEEVGRALEKVGPSLKRELENPDLNLDSLRKQHEVLREVERSLREAEPRLRRELEHSGLTIDSLREQMQELRNELNDLRKRLPEQKKGE